MGREKIVIDTAALGQCNLPKHIISGILYLYKPLVAVSILATPTLYRI